MSSGFSYSEYRRVMGPLCDSLYDSFIKNSTTVRRIDRLAFTPKTKKKAGGKTMAYLPKRMNEEDLKGVLKEEAFNYVMKFFADNPSKTTFKDKIADGQRIVIYKYLIGKSVKYTISVL